MDEAVLTILIGAAIGAFIWFAPSPTPGNWPVFAAFGAATGIAVAWTFDLGPASGFAGAIANASVLVALFFTRPNMAHRFVGVPRVCRLVALPLAVVAQVAWAFELLPVALVLPLAVLAALVTGFALYAAIRHVGVRGSDAGQ